MRTRERARLGILVEREESSTPTNKEIIAAAYASFAKGDAEVKIAHVWTLANGKVTRFQQHVDTAKERYLIA